MSSKKQIVFYSFLIYAFLLSGSWLVQTLYPTVEKPGKYEKQIEVTNRGENWVVSYHDVCKLNCSDSSVLVMIPDVYFDTEAVLPLAEYLSDSIRVIIPDFKSIHKTGFPDRFTISGKAELIRSLLNQLSFDSVHLAGHGYGGLPAVEIAVTDSMNLPVKSLTLIGSLGVQELRFLGNHHVNQSLYSIVRPLVQLYNYAFPHFGWANHQRFNLDYVDTMRRIDQRDFRDQVSGIELPVKIIHAEKDPNVPLITAKETNRLIPQSDLKVMNHDLSGYENDVTGWGNEILSFISEVNSGLATTRGGASSERVEKSNEPFDSDDVEPLHGKALVIIILLIMTFTIFSEDLSVITAGLLAAGGILPFYVAVLSVFIGIVIVDTNIYWLGKAVGSPILKRAPFRWMVAENDLNRAQNLYEMYGMELLFIARFIPGARFPTYFSAGLLKTSFKKFLIYFVISVAVWTPLLVGLTVLIGQPMIHYLTVYQDYAIWILLLTIFLIYMIVKVVIPLTTVRGRRRLLVKWARFLETWGVGR
ncbi:VTT domain-containing protein [Rhodohalobacter halophilus]|uniref:VTT domain-containing protein n=1 Tax=Rhodohalobacter halophilus TaxID=1812810 RepID=UPI00083FD5BA|nr:VTT domain-containing protein [Rhodohalobacter halophilus]